MNVIDLINNYPAIVVAVYGGVELVKAMWKHREVASANTEEKEKRVSEIVFSMLEQSKEGLEGEREQITKLTEALKRANFEISILERKVATLMNVIDKCISESPTAHLKFETAMSDFNNDMNNMRNIKNG
jgi:hypothetical protein